MSNLIDKLENIYQGKGYLHETKILNESVNIPGLKNVIGGVYKDGVGTLNGLFKSVIKGGIVGGILGSIFSAISKLSKTTGALETIKKLSSNIENKDIVIKNMKVIEYYTKDVISQTEDMIGSGFALGALIAIVISSIFILMCSYLNDSKKAADMTLNRVSKGRDKFDPESRKIIDVAIKTFKKHTKSK